MTKQPNFRIADKVAERVRSLPRYLFDDIHRTTEEALKAGVDVIDFGCGDPDMPTPQRIVRRLCNEASRSVNHRYPSYRGMAVAVFHCLFYVGFCNYSD